MYRKLLWVLIGVIGPWIAAWPQVTPSSISNSWLIPFGHLSGAVEILSGRCGTDLQTKDLQSLGFILTLSSRSGRCLLIQQVQTSVLLSCRHLYLLVEPSLTFMNFQLQNRLSNIVQLQFPREEHLKKPKSALFTDDLASWSWPSVCLANEMKEHVSHFLIHTVGL